MKILITGATGFIGGKLSEFLIQKGHSLVITTRNKNRFQKRFPCEVLQWDGVSDFPSEKIGEVEAVINLMGESVAQRWTEEKKKLLQSSRIDSTKKLVEGVLKNPGNKCSVFIQGSATGYYGDRKEELLTETSSAGTDFLAKLCVSWEGATEPLRDKGIRLVFVRTGMVLGSNGALEKMLPVFRLGLGGHLGSGNQWMSWIHIDDLVALFGFLLEEKNIVGPVNAVSPSPITNRDFTKILGKVLKRPAFFHVPETALKLALGGMATMLLSSSKVTPHAALEKGFSFHHEDLEESLESIILK